MSGSLYVSAAGAEARLTQLDVIANNLANAGTTGFRAGAVVFEEALEAALLDETHSPPGGRSFVGTTQAAMQGSAGPSRSTGRDLDAAIQGDGFLQISLPNGEFRYTRDGTMRRDGEGNLVTADGSFTEPQITLAPDAVDVIIGQDGTVLQLLAGEIEPQEVGQIQLVRFPNPSGRRPSGGVWRSPRVVSTW